MSKGETSKGGTGRSRTDKGGLSRARLARMRKVLSGHVERGAVPGLVALVSRRGETHVDALGKMAAGGEEPMRRDTIFRIASMTKPISAAAAMILVEECRLRLDDPVDPLLPELANRRVLRSIEGPLDDTVPAHRPITLRDLLTFRLGIGAVLAPPGTYPIQRAMEEAGLAPGPNPTQVPPDEWMRRLGALPLLHQPGEAYLYHTGSDVLGVLMARVTGGTLEAFFRERIFEPLGMKDTGFHVPRGKLSRLATAYRSGSRTGTLEVFDAPEGRFSRPPVFESAGGGLVSTVDDYLSFCRMMLAKGRHGRERVLSRPAVELMTTDHLTAEQKAGARLLLADNMGWGFGLAIVTRRDRLSSVPGQFGWDGGHGTSAYSDPAEDLVGILMTQRVLDSPSAPPVFQDFWTSAYQAIDD
jgi:CubicO group peptidase (beta-lactamase class C family)